MPEPDLVGLFASPLGRLGIRYMISGSVAAMLFGEPRMTHDIDLVVFLDDDGIASLPSVFAAPGFYLPPADVMRIEVARERRGHFNVIHLPSGLKADFYLAGLDELHRWAIERARAFAVAGDEVTVAPPEYVILRKLEYYREGGSEKHVRDIRAMLALSADRIDQTALLEWVDRLGLRPQWEHVSAERP